MAEDFVLMEPAVPSRLEKILKIFIVAAVVCLAGELVWLLGVTPFKPLSAIEINGFNEAPRDEIFAKAGITAATSYITADTEAIEKALMSVSYIESARVFKYFPSRLQIVLEARRPVAQALCGVNGKTVPVLIDRQGVIFSVGKEAEGFSANISSTSSAALPVISGLVIEDPFPGMRLPALFAPVFEALEKIALSSPGLLGAVSELKITRKLFDGYDLVLYPVHKKIKVRLSELSEDMLRYTLLMVDVLSATEDTVDYLDFRSGIASYIPKEVPSEQ